MHFGTLIGALLPMIGFRTGKIVRNVTSGSGKGIAGYGSYRKRSQVMLPLVGTIFASEVWLNALGTCDGKS